MGDFGPTGPTGPTGPMGTGPQGPQATLLAGAAVLSFTGLSTTVPVFQTVDTGVDRSQGIWLTGYDTNPTAGPVAIQSLYITQGGNWEATAALVGLDATSSGATMRVFYTHTA
jgi:hypothetical protein